MHQFEIHSAKSFISPSLQHKTEKVKELLEKNYIHTTSAGDRVSCDAIQQLALSNYDIFEKIMYTLQNALHNTSKDRLIMSLIDKGYFTTLEDGTVVFDPLPHNGSFDADELRAIVSYLVTQNAKIKQ